MLMRQVGRSVLMVGAALIGGLTAMLITGIVMLLASPGNVISGCHTASVRGGPEVCTSVSAFWEIVMTAGVLGTAAVVIGLLLIRHRHPIPFSD